MTPADESIRQPEMLEPAAEPPPAHATEGRPPAPPTADLAAPPEAAVAAGLAHTDQLTATPPTVGDPARLRLDRVRILSMTIAAAAHGWPVLDAYLGNLADYGLPEQEKATLRAGLQQLPRLQRFPPEDLRGWAKLSEAVFLVWRKFCEAVTPPDELPSQWLHQLGNSVATPQILAQLCRRAVAAGSFQLDTARFDALVDGQQTNELRRLGVDPYEVIPLTNSILDAWLPPDGWRPPVPWTSPQPTI